MTENDGNITIDKEPMEKRFKLTDHPSVIMLCILFTAADINECDLAITCQNGATCHNLCGSYQCTCTTGWTGSNCTVGKWDHLIVKLISQYETEAGKIL